MKTHADTYRFIFNDGTTQTVRVEDRIDSLVSLRNQALQRAQSAQRKARLTTTPARTLILNKGKFVEVDDVSLVPA